MTRARKGEPAEQAAQRRHANRLLKQTQGWFFRTREGIDIGPYKTEFDAELAASLLISRLAQLPPGPEQQAQIRFFLSDRSVAPVDVSATDWREVKAQVQKQQTGMQKPFVIYRKIRRALRSTLKFGGDSATATEA